MVKKLIQQRRHCGDIAPRHHRSGRKPIILDSHRRELRSLVSKQPDLTLEEIRARLGLACTIQAIHYVLADMGLTYRLFAKNNCRNAKIKIVQTFKLLQYEASHVRALLLILIPAHSLSL